MHEEPEMVRENNKYNNTKGTKMGIFDNIEVDAESEVVEESSVTQESGFIKDSGAYKAKITKFYFNQNDNGTTFYNWEAKTEDGRTLSDRAWFAGKTGKTNYEMKDFKTKKPTGKFKDFEGMARLKVISRALTGDVMAWQKDTEQKKVPIYNFEKQSDVDTMVDVFMGAIGKEVEILMRRTMEDKTALNSATGKYDATAEVKSFNDYRGWLDADTHKSYAETMAGTDAKAYTAFMEVIAKEPIQDNRKLSKGVDTSKPKEDAAPTEEATNAFA